MLGFSIHNLSLPSSFLGIERFSSVNAVGSHNVGGGTAIPEYLN